MTWKDLKWDSCKPISQNQFKSVEEQLEIMFPKEFRDCVLHCSGGYPDRNRFVVQDDFRKFGTSLGRLLDFRENSLGRVDKDEKI